MKKFMFFLMFVLGTLVAVQAQVDYTITNNSQATIHYTVFDSNNSNPVTVTVPATSAVTGTFPDYILPSIPWFCSANGQISGCTASGVILTSPGAGGQFFTGGCLVPLFIAWNITGTGPTYNLSVTIN